MGHYCREGITMIASKDFSKDWKKTVAYNRDGCTKIEIIKINSDKNNTETITNKFFKDYKDREMPNSYHVKAYDIGIVGYKVSVKKNKIVDHHRQEVVEVHEYKTKPKRILKNGILEELHKYIVDYDGRCYDRYEHM